MTYKTKQRDAILAFFDAHPGGCFTAKDICRALPVGEATVFRTLALLTEEGAIRKFADEGRGAVYRLSGCRENHIHLKCKTCGRLIHLDCGFMEEITRHFSAEHGFSLDCGTTILYGLCDGCGGKSCCKNGTGKECK